MMDEKLDAKKKEQLLIRVQQVLDKDILNMADWMRIYDILLEACERESASTAEQIMIASINGGDEEC